MRHRPRRRLSRAAVAFSTLLGLLAFGPAAASAERAGSTAADSNDSATAVFGKTLAAQGATFDASPGSDEASANVKTYGDRDCWEIGPGRPNQYLNVTVDARLKHEGANHAAVDIDYFDAPGTKFALVYDGGANPWRTSRIVKTTGTNTWRTAHFYIPDGAFTGGQYGRDMRIATWAQDMGSSEKPVCFARYAFAPSPVDTDDVQIDVTTPGNLFDPGERATFGVLSARDRTVPWSVRDYRGRTVRRGTATVDPATREGAVDAGELPLGYYTLTLRGTAADGAPVARTAGFAVQHPGPDPKRTTDSFFGINHHHRSAPGDAWDDSTKLAARAGADTLRVDSTYWSSIERPKGEYQWPEASERVTADFGARGQNGLMLLGFGNSDYGNIPSTDEAYQAFGKYAGKVAEKANGRIESLEVWNEYYGGFSNGVCSQSAKCYAKTLAAAYSGVKAADPKVTVVGASSFKVPLDWFEELFKLGGLKHMDAISIHPYRAPGDPEGVELDIAGLKRLMRQYNDGRELPIWITEQGWTSMRPGRRRRQRADPGTGHRTRPAGGQGRGHRPLLLVRPDQRRQRPEQRGAQLRPAAQDGPGGQRAQPEARLPLLLHRRPRTDRSEVHRAAAHRRPRPARLHLQFRARLARWRRGDHGPVEQRPQRQTGPGADREAGHRGGHARLGAGAGTGGRLGAPHGHRRPGLSAGRGGQGRAVTAAVAVRTEGHRGRRGDSGDRHTRQPCHGPR